MEQVPPTRRQADVLQEIRAYKDTWGHEPTQAELARLLGMAPATLHEHVTKLAERGWLERVLVDGGHPYLRLR